MAMVQSFFSRLQSVFLVFFHLGCFAFASRPSTPNKKKFSSFQFQYSKQTRLGNNLHLVNPWLYLKPIFSLRKPAKRSAQTQIEPAAASLCDSPDVILPTPSRKRSTGSFTEADLPADLIPTKKSSSFTFRSDNISVCSTCGEIFYGTAQLDLHQSTKHAVSELYDGDSAKNVVKIIFQTGWKLKGKDARSPLIHRILKIHNSPKILTRFEEYRESIKAKAAKVAGRRNYERCIADGNELLRFHCSTFLCSLGQDEYGGLCGHEFCGVCGIIRGGFSPKLDGIPTMGSSRRAHEAVPEELEEEFRFMNVKRAMLVCRVVAGRVASEGEAEVVEEEEGGGADKDDAGFDSVVVLGGAHPLQGSPQEELLVFSPRAVLPCFVIVYSVSG